LSDGTTHPAAPVSRDTRAGLVSRQTGAMLVRNTAISCLIFGINIALLYALVERGGMSPLPAAVLAFVVANSFQYVLARKWVFRGTDRGVASGYAYALINAGLGLAITISLYAAVIRFTTIDYMTGRVLVSLVAGLVVFVLNATFNFGRIAMPWAGRDRAE
jgi:putative flippase GtrA